MKLSVQISLIIGVPTLIFTLITVLKILQDWINQYFVQKIVYQYLSLSEYYLKLNGNRFSNSDFVKTNNKNNFLSFSMQEILRKTVLPFVKNIEPIFFEKIDIFYIKNILSFLSLKDLKNISKINNMYLAKMKKIANWLNRLNFYSVEKSEVINNNETIFIGDKNKYKEYLDLFDTYFKYDFSIFVDSISLTNMAEKIVFTDLKISLDNKNNKTLKLSETWDIVINNLEVNGINTIDFIIHMKEDKYINTSLTKWIYNLNNLTLDFKQELMQNLNSLISLRNGPKNFGMYIINNSKTLSIYEVIQNFIENLNTDNEFKNIFFKDSKNLFSDIFIHSSFFSNIFNRFWRFCIWANKQ